MMYSLRTLHTRNDLQLQQWTLALSLEVDTLEAAHHTRLPKLPVLPHIHCDTFIWLYFLSFHTCNSSQASEQLAQGDAVVPMASKHLLSIKPRPPTKFVGCMDGLPRERSEMARGELCCIVCLLNLFYLIGLGSFQSLCCLLFHSFLQWLGVLRGSKKDSYLEYVWQKPKGLGQSYKGLARRSTLLRKTALPKKWASM